jgi:parallel beta-helix repeat protein
VPSGIILQEAQLMYGIKVKNFMVVLLIILPLLSIGCSEPGGSSEDVTDDQSLEETSGAEFALEPASSESVIHVPGDYNSIQTAIDRAEEGQTIIVSAGTYYENLNMRGKEITLQSSDPGNPEIVENTIIDGEGKGTVITFNSGEGIGSKLFGFTITGGSGTRAEYNIESYDGSELNFIRIYGGGILVANSSPTIMHNIISGNRVNSISEEEQGVGGGIAVLDNASPYIANNVFKHNFAEGHGGGIAVWYHANPVIENNIIEGNKANDIGGGIMVAMSCSPEIKENTILNNSADWGGGIYVAHKSEAEIISNRIEANEADLGAGVFVRRTEKVFLADNLITSNIARRYGGAIYVDNRATATVHYNYIEYNHAALAGGGIWVDTDSRVYLIWLDKDTLPHYAWPDEYNNQGNTPENINLVREDFVDKVDNSFSFRHREIEDFFDKAFNLGFNFMGDGFPVFNNPLELGNRDLLAILITSGFTPFYYDKDTYTTIVKREDVEKTAKILFGPHIKEVFHDSAAYYGWNSEKNQYEGRWDFGPPGEYAEMKVVAIEENLREYILDVVYLTVIWEPYYDTGSYIYDDNGNLVTHLYFKGDYSDYLPFMPKRHFILTKAGDGVYYISQHYKTE